MNKERFLNNFNKVFGESEKETYIFKAAHPLILMGYCGEKISDDILACCINPDSGVGIRKNAGGDVVLRFAESDIAYRCAKENLMSYSEKNPAKPFFYIIGRNENFVNNDGGAEIFLYRESNENGFDNSKVAVAYAFSDLYSKSPKTCEIAEAVCNDKKNYSDYIYNSISLMADKEGVLLVDDKKYSYHPNIFKKYKVVTAITENKEQNENVFSVMAMQMKDNVKVVAENIQECANASFVKNEKERIKKAVGYIRSADIKELGKLITESANEKIRINSHCSEKVKKLFEIVNVITPICGIYRNQGVFAFVENENVDEFVKAVEKVFEKNAEKKPRFLISDVSKTGKL